jgi:hypothetical protein
LKTQGPSPLRLSARHARTHALARAVMHAHTHLRAVRGGTAARPCAPLICTGCSITNCSGGNMGVTRGHGDCMCEVVISPVMSRVYMYVCVCAHPLSLSLSPLLPLFLSLSLSLYNLYCTRSRVRVPSGMQSVHWELLEKRRIREQTGMHPSLPVCSVRARCVCMCVCLRECQPHRL